MHYPKPAEKRMDLTIPTKSETGLKDDDSDMNFIKGRLNVFIMYSPCFHEKNAKKKKLNIFFI